jgi:hypothetical protein
VRLRYRLKASSTSERLDIVSPQFEGDPGPVTGTPASLDATGLVEPAVLDGANDLPAHEEGGVRQVATDREPVAGEERLAPPPPRDAAGEQRFGYLKRVV